MGLDVLLYSSSHIAMNYKTRGSIKEDIDIEHAKVLLGLSGALFSNLSQNLKTAPRRVKETIF